MEGVLFKCLFWNANNSIVKTVFLCDTDLVIKICQIMTATTSGKNLRQYKSKFPLAVEQILVFASNTNMVREVKNLPSNFKKIK